jgi:rhodanese-related sulfurtransferase
MQAAPMQAAPMQAASIPSTDLLEPSAFAAALRNDSAPKPLILQVGFRTLYNQAHIPGSEYAGAGSEAAGLHSLKDRVAGLPRTSAIVIYCGCCPWGRCPNVAEAWAALHELGFTRLKVLYIANDFGTDWVDKGYPATKGS